MLEKKLLATSLIIKVYVKRNKDERKELKGTASISKTSSNYSSRGWRYREGCVLRQVDLALYITFFQSIYGF